MTASQFDIIKKIADTVPNSFTSVVFESWSDAYLMWKQVRGTSVETGIIRLLTSGSTIQFTSFVDSLSCRGHQRDNLILTFKPSVEMEHELTIRTQNIVMYLDNAKNLSLVWKKKNEFK